MDYKEKYNAALERARQFIEHPLQEDSANIVEYILPELAESEDERTRKEILNVFKQLDEGTTICGRNYDYAKWIAWLEKQGEQKTDPYIGCTNDKGCVTCEHGELRETPTRTLTADKVIAWLVANICDYDYYVKLFKKDFGL